MSEEVGTSNASDGGEVDVAALAKSVDDARAKLAMLQELQQASRVQTVLLVLVLVAIVLIFGVKTFTQMRSNFGPEQMETAFWERAPVIANDLQRIGMSALQRSWPSIQEQSLAKVKAVAPKLQADIEERVRTLPDELEAMVVEKLSAASNRVAVTIQQKTKATFPYLADERAEGIALHLADSLGRESDTFTKHAATIVENELHRLGEIFTKFEVPPLENLDDYELERQFAHELIMYADMELMAIGTPDELPLTDTISQD